MTPKATPSAQAAWGGQDSVEVLPAGAYTWAFKDNGDGYMYVAFWVCFYTNVTTY